MESTINNAATVTEIHVFERAGLGPAPYRYLGVTKNVFKAAPDCPAQPGSTCDYCGTAIMYEYWIKARDGRRSKVGCDCIMKAGDAGLIRMIDADRKAAEREVRHAREQARVAEARAMIARPEIAAKLAAQPSPITWRAEAPNNETALDHVNFLLAHGGAKGCTKAARMIEAAAKAPEITSAEIEAQAARKLAANKAEAERAAAARAEEARKAELFDRWLPVVEALERNAITSGFCADVARQIRGGRAPSGRAADIALEIYAKEHGRKGSRAYWQALKSIDERINPPTP